MPGVVLPVDQPARRDAVGPQAKACATLLLLFASTAAGADWVRLRAPGLELLTDAGEKAGRQALTRLEQVRAAFPDPQSAGPLELRLYLFDSEKEFRGYTARSVAGFYQSGFDRDTIVAHVSAGLPRVVVHEYTHFVLHRRGAGLPAWLEEGLAELYSNVEFTRDGLRVGEPLEVHLGLLKRARWLTAAELLGPPPAAAESPQGSLYYAQAWALAHMLNLAPAYRDGMPGFAQALADGQEETAAFSDAFGRTFARALGDLRSYVNNVRPATVRAAAPAATPSSPAERLTALEALLLRAELALRSGRMDTARPLYLEAKRAYPEAAAAEAGLGALAFAESKPSEARTHLEAALKLDAGDGSAWFQYALLERDAGTPAARLRELLERAVELNPRLGEAHAMLGIRATDDGRLADALRHLQQAAALLPRKSYVWHALAFAQQKSGDAAALRSAQQALRTATTREHVRMAEALIESLR